MFFLRAITAEEHLASLSDDLINNKEQIEKTCKILETLFEGANEKLQSSQSCLQQASMALNKLQGKDIQKKAMGKYFATYKLKKDGLSEIVSCPSGALLIFIVCFRLQNA